MSASHNPLRIEMRKQYRDGGEFLEEIQGFEIASPFISASHYDIGDDWALGPSVDHHPSMTVTITGNVGLYEKLKRLVTDCNKPLGPLPPPPLGPPSQLSSRKVQAVLAFALLALALLASGLG